MIFALADDNMLSVHDSVDEMQGACEGIDVENGIFQFFDKKGAPLKPEFIEPNTQGRLFGIIPWVGSGAYTLISSKGANEPTLIELLPSIFGIVENPYFNDLNQVHQFLTKGST